MTRGKLLPWESVRRDVCRHYGDGKTLLEVQTIMLRERSFEASTRAYRMKLREWKAKRIDTANGNISPDPPAITSTTQFAHTHVIATDRDEIATPLQYHIQPLEQHICGEVGHSEPVNGQTLDVQQYPPDTNHFDGLLRCIHEAPSSESLIQLLYTKSFYSNGSHLLHHIAAKGRMSEVLKDVLQCYKHYRFSIDLANDDGLSPLHIAIQNDRVENALALLAGGAALDNPDPSGALPLHTAIMNVDKDLRLVEKILHRSPDSAKIRMGAPSEDRGKIALDLVVDRLLNEMSVSVDKACTKTTKRLLMEITKITPTIADTAFLRQHLVTDWTLFMQATTAIGNAAFAKELSDTMARVMYKDPQAHRRFIRWVDHHNKLTGGSNVAMVAGSILS